MGQVRALSLDLNAMIQLIVIFLKLLEKSFTSNINSMSIKIFLALVLVDGMRRLSIIELLT
jgi:hypothetical protein